MKLENKGQIIRKALGNLRTNWKEIIDFENKEQIALKRIENVRVRIIPLHRVRKRIKISERNDKI